MKIACFLYPRFTSADLINPITVWQFVPGVQFEFIAAEKGPVETDMPADWRGPARAAGIGTQPERGGSAGLKTRSWR